MRASAYYDTSTGSIVAGGKNVSWLASAIRPSGALPCYVDVVTST